MLKSAEVTGKIQTLEKGTESCCLVRSRRVSKSFCTLETAMKTINEEEKNSIQVVVKAISHTSYFKLGQTPVLAPPCPRCPHSTSYSGRTRKVIVSRKPDSLMQISSTAQTHLSSVSLKYGANSFAVATATDFSLTNLPYIGFTPRMPANIPY